MLVYSIQFAEYALTFTIDIRTENIHIGNDTDEEASEDSELREAQEHFESLDRQEIIVIDELMAGNETQFDLTYFFEQGEEVGLVFLTELNISDVNITMDANASMLNRSAGMTGENEGWQFHFSAFIIEDEGETTVRYQMYFENGENATFHVRFIAAGLDADFSDHLEDVEEEIIEDAISSMRDLDRVIRDLDRFYVVRLDDSFSDTEIVISPEPGQVIGTLVFTEDPQIQLFANEEAYGTDVVTFVDSHSWELYELGVKYWFSMFAVGRNATVGDQA